MLPETLAHLPQPKLLHGVGAPLGGTCAAPEAHAACLRGDIAALQPVHVSEHVSLTQFRVDGGNATCFAGFMLPPLQSRAGLSLIADNIRRHRAALGGIALAVETPVSYLPPLPGEWPDGEFMRAVAETADCGILLDLHNVLCNARNGRQSVSEYCSSLPHDRVWEIHLAGGETVSGYHVDAHSGPCDAELMDVAAELVPRLPNLRAMIFEIMPERVAEVGLASIARQIEAMKDIWLRRPAGQPAVAPTGQSSARGIEPELDVFAWEQLLGSATIGRPTPPLSDEIAAWWRAAAPALELYHRLASEGRASAIAGAAPTTTRLLLRHKGGPDVRCLLDEFWQTTPPSYMACDEVRGFFAFLASKGVEAPGLGDAIAADAERM